MPAWLDATLVALLVTAAVLYVMRALRRPACARCEGAAIAPKGPVRRGVAALGIGRRRAGAAPPS